MLIHGFIPCGDDWGYHIDRIIEISNNMRHGNFFPMMYTYTFRKIGYLLGAFYPWITLLPFAILKNLISNQVVAIALGFAFYIFISLNLTRSEEHTSELQSRGHLVCRLLLEKK